MEIDIVYSVFKFLYLWTLYQTEKCTTFQNRREIQMKEIQFSKIEICKQIGGNFVGKGKNIY